MDVTMLEGQRAQLKWQQQPPYESSSQQPQQSCLNETQFSAFSLQQPTMMQLHELINNDPAAAQELANGWPELGKYPLPRRGSSRETTMGFISPTPPGLVTDPVEMGYYISNTASCSLVEEKGGESVFSVSKKRKIEKVAEDTKEKRTKADEEVESKVTEQNNSRQTDTSKDTSKGSEVQKPDYIHVRARRGQATDSHSLAERVRRERISERMKYLQDLVPGCNKITGKAGMLDEIINYVQSLQRQVEFLSMKLAAVNPRPDFNMENSSKKEILPTCTSSYPTMGISSELTNPSYFQFSNAVHEVVNSSETTTRRSISTPTFRMPEPFIDSSCFNVQFPSSSSWDSGLQGLYNVEPYQGRSTLHTSQPFTGTLEASNILKMEM